MQVTHHYSCACTKCEIESKSNHGELVADRYETPTHTFYAVSQSFRGGVWYVQYRSVPKDAAIGGASEGQVALLFWNRQAQANLTR